MKTTVEIADGLLNESKKFMARHGFSFRNLVETALRRHLDAAARPDARYKWRKRAFRGDGLTDELKGAGWEDIRRRIYEGRGG